MQHTQASTPAPQRHSSQEFPAAAFNAAGADSDAGAAVVAAASGASVAQPDGADTVKRSLLLSGVYLPSFVGLKEQLLDDLRQAHPQVSFHLRDHLLTLSGDSVAVDLAAKVVLEMLEVARLQANPTKRDLAQLSKFGTEITGKGRTLAEPILRVRQRAIRPQTSGQRDYVAAMQESQVVFCTGPAGSGKTFLAIALAVQALTRREVSKIVLTRPAVEAGERLGYLPGSLEDKIDPYLRPLFDALSSMMEADTVPKLLEAGTIEVAPLAYMRGRTLNESFVILDEAQNTTPEQMKMFLTRLGYDSRMVITGDLTQNDLASKHNGLQDALQVLQAVPGIGFAQLSTEDIVRNDLVSRIVDAYAEAG